MAQPPHLSRPESPATASRGAPAARDLSGPASGHRVRVRGRALDRFLAGVLANSVAMVGVGLTVFWLVDRDHRQQASEQAEWRERLDLERAENDRLTAINHELATQVHDLSAQARVVDWQLRYTQERLQRERAGAALARSEAARAEASARVAALASSASAIQPLDGVASASRERAIDRIATGSDGAEGGVALGRAGLDLDDFEPEQPALSRIPSQRDRDVAMGTWDALVDEAAVAECGHGATGVGHRCRQDMERRLAPFAAQAVDCIVSGNAVPDYVVNERRSDLPSHAIRLDKGAIIMCDAALRNW